MTSIACFTGYMSIVTKENARLFLSGRCWSRSSLFGNTRRGVQTATPETTVIEGEDEGEANDEDRIQRLRDISRLRPWHRNRIHGRVPHEEPVAPHHYTVGHHKRMFGRYGYASGVNPSVCWPTKEELEDKKEYESVAYPYTILEVANRERAKREQEEKERWDRDAMIAENVQTMLKLKDEFLQRQEIRKADAEANKAFKLRLIEEVRLHFNYTVNERDERFKLELKERAKRLKDEEKNRIKMSKKEKLAADKAMKLEVQKKKLMEAESKRAAARQKEDD